MVMSKKTIGLLGFVICTDIVTVSYLVKTKYKCYFPDNTIDVGTIESPGETCYGSQLGSKYSPREKAR